MKIFSKKGSALLVVLGLLGFLMISAVAFSIAMRTENKAAANYKHSVTARELLQAAFADARITVERAMLDQLPPGEKFPIKDIGLRYRNALWPFAQRRNSAITRQDDVPFARLLSSCPTDLTNDTFVDRYQNNWAYLLDINMMNHIPVYVSYVTKSLLENDNYPGGVVNDLNSQLLCDPQGGAQPYALIDAAPRWKPIEVERDNSSSILGRMAWTVINVSDGIDINALYGISTKRGVGLLASDLAFTTDNVNTAFLKTSSNDPEGEPLLNGGGYGSVADITRAVLFDNDAASLFDINRFHWGKVKDSDYTAATKLFSPFVTYSYWPATNRTSITSTTTSGSNITCSDVKGNYDSLKSKLEDPLINANLFDKDRDRIERFIASLTDYIDTDAEPVDFEGEHGGLCLPTVEATPMIAAISFDASVLINKLTDNIQNNFSPDVDTTTDPTETITLNISPLADTAVSIESTIVYPFKHIASESCDFTLDAFYGLTIKQPGDSNPSTSKAYLCASEAKSISFPASDDNEVPEELFTKAIKPSNDSEEISLDKIPISVAGEDSTITIVVDFYFRPKIEAGSTMVDAAPYGDPNADFHTASDLSKRFTRTGADLGTIDDQLRRNAFRITYAYKANVHAQWEQQQAAQNGQPASYKATITISAPEIADGFQTPGNSGNNNSLITFPEQGIWTTVDPRYNWYTPMYGCANLLSPLNGEGLNTLSSSHWIFIEGGAMENWEDPANNYLAAYPVLGINKRSRIFYNVSDLGQLILPAELGFLPYPLSDTICPLEPQSRDNNANNEEWRRAYFRTVPIFPMRIRESDADTYTCSELLSLFSSEIKGFEEHRGLIHAFAGQDDSAIGFNLYTIALQGMPATIQEAMKITATRQTADDYLQLKIDNIDDIEAAVSDVKISETHPYDEFVTNPDVGLFSDFSQSAWDAYNRPQTRDILADEAIDFTGKLIKYNQSNSNNPLSQADATTFYAMAREIFGDRQQLFLYLLRTETVALAIGQSLESAPSLASARAVALVWRDAYGYLPDRVVYFQILP